VFFFFFWSSFEDISLQLLGIYLGYIFEYFVGSLDFILKFLGAVLEIFVIFKYFAGTVFLLAVLVIFLPSLEASPWDTFFQYIAFSLYLQAVVLMEQF